MGFLVKKVVETRTYHKCKERVEVRICLALFTAQQNPQILPHRLILARYRNIDYSIVMRT